jgi:metal-responsive CopG/Arc/MetJ family transcriptional regulator
MEMKIRIEIHLSEQEAKALDKIAKQDGRSRKNYCETSIRSIIKSFEGGQKKIKTNCV